MLRNRSSSIGVEVESLDFSNIQTLGTRLEGISLHELSVSRNDNRTKYTSQSISHFLPSGQRVADAVIQSAVLSSPNIVTSEHIEAAFRLFRDWEEGTVTPVGGLASVQSELRNLLLLPFRCRTLFAATPFPLQQGALLIGPPGCGKTFLARSICAECNLKVFRSVFAEYLQRSFSFFVA